MIIVRTYGRALDLARSAMRGTGNWRVGDPMLCSDTHLCHDGSCYLCAGHECHDGGCDERKRAVLAEGQTEEQLKAAYAAALTSANELTWSEICAVVDSWWARCGAKLIERSAP